MNQETSDYDKWTNSAEGLSAAKIETLGGKTKDAQYLRNRLWKAYMAGYAAGRKAQISESTERLRKIISG